MALQSGFRENQIISSTPPQLNSHIKLKGIKNGGNISANVKKNYHTTIRHFPNKLLSFLSKFDEQCWIHRIDEATKSFYITSVSQSLSYRGTQIIANILMVRWGKETLLMMNCLEALMPGLFRTNILAYLLIHSHSSLAKPKNLIVKYLIHTLETTEMFLPNPLPLNTFNEKRVCHWMTQFWRWLLG